MIEAMLAGLFGLLIGSFLNVCIYRLPRDQSVVAPRSFCPGCQKTIAWYDNVPILSFLWLRGKCRRCGVAISWRYPLVELLTGASCFAGVLILGPGIVALKFCTFAAIQVVLLFSDLEERILPDEFTLGGILAGLLFAAAIPGLAQFFTILAPDDWNPRLVAVFEATSSAAFLSIVLWMIGAAYAKIRGREGLGFGDVKMLGMIGAFLGLGGALLTLMLASILGTVCGLLYIYLARKDLQTYELPFGSFLAVAALMVNFLTAAGTLASPI